MVKVKANNGTTLDVKNTLETVFINNEEIKVNLSILDKDTFHILYNDRSYKVNVSDINHATKTCTLNINGKKIAFEIKDSYDELLERMGMSATNTKLLNELKAPMPGLVLRILVKEGDKVNKGEGLMILEAMKMENILKSPGEGVVKKIQVNIKDTVEKGQLLISF